MSVATRPATRWFIMPPTTADPEGIACGLGNILFLWRRNVRDFFTNLSPLRFCGAQQRINDSIRLGRGLDKYTTGIVQNKKQKMLAINGMPDHVHMLLGIKPSCRPSDSVRETKKATNEWINENRLTNCLFKWQEGYGVFSHGHGSISSVISYIMNQKEHHRHKTFQEEYLGFLKKFDIPFKDEYVFRWIK